ncbi:hypothetical protein [Pseudoduganella violaceinigra]|uniref:hypothetical protein n=1 Tax=Pseudoduganella violaceinigra TaxID=246602 RepID=UPI000406EF02|nr:hypothetical protein [Pseudoduganella violaceinigra]
MGTGEILHSAGQALFLIGAAPWSLLAGVLVFFLVAEVLMLVPRIGFVLKFCAAALLAPQILAMLRIASLGETPSLRILADVIYLPPSTMLVLCGCALLPFFLGLSYFAASGRTVALRFFFGNVRRQKAPEARHFLIFKLLMTVAALPFTYVAPAVVLKGYIGGNALEQGLLAGMLYWPSLAALLMLALGFELLVWLLPRRVTALLAAPLVAAFLLFLFAFTYALSVRAFGV